MGAEGLRIEGTPPAEIISTKKHVSTFLGGY
jgi:hypothetical protein